MGAKMEVLRQKKLIPLLMSLDPHSMKTLAMTIGKIIVENLDYWRLMYIDVVEFRHKHFIDSFREIAGELRTYSRILAQSGKLKFPRALTRPWP